MKLDATRIAGLMARPGDCRAVLLHGEDQGLIRERAETLTRGVTGDLHDPFRVVELARDRWADLGAEMAAISMLGGRRVVRVRDAADSVLEPLRAGLRGPGEALVILEAPELGRGKLRTFFDGAETSVVSIACYAEQGAALTATIRRGLADRQVTAEADALAWLAGSLGGDQGSVRAGIEAVSLYVGPGGTVDLESARLVCGEAAGVSLDAGLLAALRGDQVECDGAVEQAISEGANAIALVRSALALLQRLHQARLRVDEGMSASDAIKSLRPPVFFKSAGAMAACVGLWREPALRAAIEEARRTEMACKMTGSRPEWLGRQFVAALARRAAQPAGRVSPSTARR